MAGKPLFSLWVEKYGEQEAQRRREAYEKTQRKGTSARWQNLSPEAQKQMTKSFSEQNPAKGKSHLQLYIDKYGEVEGKQKFEEHSKNLIGKASGNKNGMFGKVPPPGAGGGWSGWYKGWFFRSLLELSFMINYIEKNNLRWESAEIATAAIPYQDNKKTYFADFILNKEILAEVKPKRLRGVSQVLLKEAAAQSWVLSKGLRYIIFTEEDFSKLKESEINELYDTGVIKLLPRIEEKYRKRRGL